MDTQQTCKEDERVEQSPAKKPYATPVLVVLGTFSELTLSIGPNGHNDGGSQRGRRSTRF